MVSMYTISVTGLKGGSGKTSTAVPLAMQALRPDAWPKQQLAGGRTVLIDMDPEPGAARWVQVAGLDVPTLRVKPEELPARIKELSNEYDWCFIDTPASRAEVAQSAMLHSDLVLIPVHIGSGDVDNLVSTVRLLAKPLAVRPDLLIRVVLNHAGTLPAVTRQTRYDVEQFGIQVLKTEIPYRSRYATARGNKPDGEDYPKLWREIMELIKRG